MTIYLYVKTHKITGLKYLGKTEAKNPHKYKGSGTYWLSHLKVHGTEYTTEIIKECQSKEDLKYWGKYYSDLWDVVQSTEWANLKEEVGDGGRQSEEVRKRIGEAGRGRTPWNKGKRIWSEDDRKRIGTQNKLRGPQTADTIAKRVSKNTGKKRTLDQKQRISNSLKGKKFTDERKLKLWGKRPDVVAHNRDHNIYTFIHYTGIVEKCTRNELIIKYSLCGQNLTSVVKGRRKSHKGWRLVN